MIEALVVDIDGVLVRGRPGDNRRWHTDLAADLGIRYDDLQTHFFAPYWQDIIIGRRRLRDLLTPVLAKIAPHLSAEELIAYWFAHDSALDHEVLRQVDRARATGMRTVVATNQEHERSHYLWHDLRLREHFDSMVFSAAVGAKKPDAPFYQSVTELLNVRPDAVLFIDDTFENIAAAQSQGWQAILWEGQDKSGSILLDYVL
jgi:putative hydrolase of the HAD superfamily